MTPIQFPEANRRFGAPQGLSPEQVATIPAFVGPIEGGSLDGELQVVVAYRLTNDEILELANGGLLYFSMVGGLAPHYPSLSFEAATHPA